MQDNNEKKTKKRIPKAVSAIIIALLFLLTFIGGYFSNYIFASRETMVLREITEIIKKVGYVVDEETGEFIELDEEDFADAVVGEFLDIYSAYYTPEEYKLVSEQSRGHEQGLGFVFNVKEPIVYRVKGNSPVEKAGFLKNDILLSGRQEGMQSVEFTSTTQAIDYMNECASDKPIEFTVMRNGEKIQISVSKSIYTASYINYYDSEGKYYFRSETLEGKPKGMLDESLGKSQLQKDTAYITFDAFEGDCAEQMREALEIMKERGRTKLVLDISENGGGQVNILCDIAAFLIKNGGKGNFPVLYSKSKTGTEKFSSGKYRCFENITDIAVIASENSASASECLIGALTHYGGAFSAERLIIEKNDQGVAKTYGKGIMQTTYPLPSGGALKLTTAKIFWPDQTTCIHGTGVIATGENAVEVGGGLARAIEALA